MKRWGGAILACGAVDLVKIREHFKRYLVVLNNGEHSQHENGRRGVGMDIVRLQRVLVVAWVCVHNAVW